VKLTVGNKFNCTSKEVVFPIRINFETEAPQGLINVCANLRSDKVYEIPPTNGSTYTWGITGGLIKGGQGKGKVTVDWSESGEHELW